MHYAGGKFKLRKKICAIISEYRKDEQLYIEPFVGGCNIFSEITLPKIGGDNNEYVVAMWNKARNGWLPEEFIDEDMYYKIRTDKNLYPPELVGFSCVACSFGGNFADSFAKSKRDAERKYFDIGIRNLIRQRQGLIGSKILYGDYTQFSYVKNAIFYCDPPYNMARQKYKTNKFDSEKFWQWCCEMAKKKNTMLISEYSAPKGIKIIAEFSTLKNIGAWANAAQKKTEYLYLIK
jgi:site-specific DNA-adenine methylase